MNREDELDKELRFHIDERIDALVAEGVTLEEARRRTRLEFGGVMQVKEAGVWLFMNERATRCAGCLAWRTRRFRRRRRP
jgi:hypothetical protein